MLSELRTLAAIEKGYSGERKLKAVGEDGTKYLLRISSPDLLENRQRLLFRLQELFQMGIPMNEPMKLIVGDEGVITVLKWLEGEDAEIVLPLLPLTEQYELGYHSGEILRKIHSLPAPEPHEDWETRFCRKVDGKISNYQACPVKFRGDQLLIDYIDEHRHLLKNRPQCFHHGDYHTGNMLICGGELYIIDFDRYDHGDPWEEFNRIVWSVDLSPWFAAGQLDGYFEGEPPRLFFELMALYISSNTLSSVPWAIPFGSQEVATMIRQSQQVLSWYEDMTQPVPKWYRDIRSFLQSAQEDS